MIKRKNSRQKSNRGSDMDMALFEALDSAVPDKNTGPDPDDILRDVFEEKAEDNTEDLPLRARTVTQFAVSLDGIERERAKQIVDLVREQTGEQIDLALAVKIALHASPLDEQVIYKVYREICVGRRDD